MELERLQAAAKVTEASLHELQQSHEATRRSLLAAEQQAATAEEARAALDSRVRELSTQLEEKTKAASDGARRIQQLDAEIGALALKSVRRAQWGRTLSTTTQAAPCWMHERTADMRCQSPLPLLVWRFSGRARTRGSCKSLQTPSIVVKRKSRLFPSTEVCASDGAVAAGCGERLGS